MKKILGISLVAVLAATPLMARADDLTADQLAHGEIIAANGNDLGDAGKMATVSYVKGAYTELGTAINTKQDQITAGGSEVSTSVVQAAAMSGKTVATASDTALMSEKAVLTAIGTADNAMDARVDALETTVGDSTSGLVKGLADEISRAEGVESGLQAAITTLNGDSTVTGSVDKKIADAISEVNTAAGTLAGRVTANENAIGVLNGSGEGSVAAAVAAEATLRQNADTTLQDNIDAEANTRQQADTAINNKIGNTTMTTSNQTLTGAIEEVKQSVSTLSGAANTTYAKKVGVTQTISDSTISGTVPVVTDWANQTAGTVAINARITGAEYAEPAGI